MKTNVFVWLCGRAMVVFAVVAAAIAVVLVGSSARAATPPFVAIDLGTLGGASSSAVAVNEKGQVVGSSETASGATHVFSWTQAGGMVDLGTDGSPVALSEAGQMVGNITSGPDKLAFSWTKEGGIVYLGTLGGPSSTAVDVNANGLVIGNSTTASGESHPFAWSQAEGMVDLGTLGGPDAVAADVNDAGQVVGWSQTAAGGVHPFLWTRAYGLRDLGFWHHAWWCDSVASSDEYGYANAINASGQVAGSLDVCWYPGERWSWGNAVFWTPTSVQYSGTGALRSLAINDAGQVLAQFTNPDPHGGSVWRAAELWTVGGGLVTVFDGQAADLNNRGEVVGMWADGCGLGRAAYWTAAGGTVSLGECYSYAADINDAGVIVGSTGGHAVLWHPASGDTTPPTLTVPTAVTVDATSPAGATVSFNTSATDNVDVAPSVTCTPASGTLFPIGDTGVTCTARDSSWNQSSASFVVHVRGTAEQLANLAGSVVGVGPGKSLAGKVADADGALAAGDRVAASSILNAFIHEVSVQTGKQIPRAAAATLTATAQRIIAVLG
jgi:probable HAF family extracellular repeat protein